MRRLRSPRLLPVLLLHRHRCWKAEVAVVDILIWLKSFPMSIDQNRHQSVSIAWSLFSQACLWLFRSMSSSFDLTSTGRSFSTDRVETWLIQEYCDMGSLDKAIRKGKFVKGQRLNMVVSSIPPRLNGPSHRGCHFRSWSSRHVWISVEECST